MGVGFQAQCDNELSWGREGQNSFWTWTWPVKKLDKLGEGGTFNSKSISLRGKLLKEVKNKQSNIPFRSDQSLLLPGWVGYVPSSTW